MTAGFIPALIRLKQGLAEFHLLSLICKIFRLGRSLAAKCVNSLSQARAKSLLTPTTARLNFVFFLTFQMIKIWLTHSIRARIFIWLPLLRCLIFLFKWLPLKWEAGQRLLISALFTVSAHFLLQRISVFQIKRLSSILKIILPITAV